MPELRAFAFGATVAIAIGPIALLIVNYGLTSGLRAAVESGLGAALADFTYGLVAFAAGHALAPALAARAGGIRLVASAVLVGFGIWMAVSALRRRRAAAVGPAAARPWTRGGPLVATYLLTVVNPMTVIAFLGFAVQLPLGGSLARSAWYAACLFAGSLCIQLLLAAAGAGLGRIVADPRWTTAANVASGAGIAAFGIAGLLR